MGPHGKVVQKKEKKGCVVEVGGGQSKQGKERVAGEASDWNPRICSQHRDFHLDLQESVIISELDFMKYFIYPDTRKHYFILRFKVF